MKTLKYLSVLSIVFWMAACSTDGGDQGSQETAATATYRYDNTLELPDGFRAAVVTDSIGFARHIAVRPNGDIYVQLLRLKDGKGTVALRDTNGDAQADIVRYFGDFTGTGMGLYKDYLYASSNSAVYRYDLPEGQLAPDEATRTLIVGGFPDQRSHPNKNFTFDKEGHIYVNVGAPSNACMEEARTKGSPGMDPCPQLEWQAGIWQFDAETPAQTQQKDGKRYATGIRNAVATRWNDEVDQLYALQHGRDQFFQFFPELFDEKASAELPSEEFLAIEEGDDFGWPYCYFDHFQDKKLLNPEYGGDTKIQGRCADVKRPIMAFPGHLAPNDLVFYTGDQFPEKYRNGAFIAFHGSWNRAPEIQEGYYVVFVPMKDGLPSGDWEIFADGFAGVDPVEAPRDARHRPMGLAIGPDGALYVTDSRKGKIWKIVYDGELTM